MGVQGLRGWCWAGWHGSDSGARNGHGDTTGTWGQHYRGQRLSRTRCWRLTGPGCCLDIVTGGWHQWGHLSWGESGIPGPTQCCLYSGTRWMGPGKRQLQRAAQEPGAVAVTCAASQECGEEVCRACSQGRSSESLKCVCRYNLSGWVSALHPGVGRLCPLALVPPLCGRR